MTIQRTGFTRRTVLGGVAALTALPARAAAPAVAPAPGRIMTVLSAYMASAANRPLPEAVAERAKVAILDTLGAIVSGSGLEPGKVALKFAAAYRGDNRATIPASNILCGPVEAALVNGMLAHSDETDDTHPASLSHPGAAVVPAGLAVGETLNASGERFLRAVALGYDLGPRVTMMLGERAYMAEAHRSTHAISGTFGAAASAGCMIGLNAQQMRWLLAYTAEQTSGIASWQRDTQHIWKSFDFAGMPARNGVTSALLVEAGGTALDDVFSGADNFLEAFKPMHPPEILIEGLGTRYELMRTDVKKWTVGSPIQAPLDALYNLQQKNGFSAGAVKSVEVRVGAHEATVVDNREIPDICLQHMIAVMLLDKTASFKAAHDVARMKDAAVLRERAKVRLIGDDELDKLLPKRVAVVEVTLNDGKMLRERVDTVRGTVGNPMPRSEIIEKARDLIAPVLGAEKFVKLSDAIFSLEKLKSVRELRPLLQKT